MSDHTSNLFLDADLSSEDRDSDTGYDSEAGEVAKGGRTVPTKVRASQQISKKRKISPVSEDEVSDADEVIAEPRPGQSKSIADRASSEVTPVLSNKKSEHPDKCLPLPPSKSENPASSVEPSVSQTPPTTKQKRNPTPKPTKPGVIYLSSLPPHLKPSALRNLFSQRGFSPITRLFLTPSLPPSSSSSTTNRTSASNKRKTYTEGWLEFPNHKTAKRAVAALNAQPIGGRKGGYYHDDLLNMRYLRGLGWDELMAQMREERREEEVRREGERERARREERVLREGVERGKVERTREEKRKGRKGGNSGEEAKKGGGEGDGIEEGEVRRTWAQFEVKQGVKRRRRGREKGGEGRIDDNDGIDGVDEDAKRVLSKIF